MKKLSSEDRTSLIKLAASLPKGSSEKKILLASLKSAEDEAGGGGGGVSGAYIEFMKEVGDNKIRNPDTGNDVMMKSLKGPKGKKLIQKEFEAWKEKREKDSGSKGKGGGGGVKDPKSMTTKDIGEFAKAGVIDMEEWEDMGAPALKTLEKALSGGGGTKNDILGALDELDGFRADEKPKGAGARKKKEMAKAFNAKLDELTKAGEEAAKNSDKKAPAKKDPAKDKEQQERAEKIKTLEKKVQDNKDSVKKNAPAAAALGYKGEVADLPAMIKRKGLPRDTKKIKNLLADKDLSDDVRKAITDEVKKTVKEKEKALVRSTEKEIEKELGKLRDSTYGEEELLDMVKDPKFNIDEDMPIGTIDEGQMKSLRDAWQKADKGIQSLRDLTSGKNASRTRRLARLLREEGILSRPR
jgi:hypothetical protein